MLRSVAAEFPLTPPRAAAFQRARHLPRPPWKLNGRSSFDAEEAACPLDNAEENEPARC